MAAAAGLSALDRPITLRAGTAEVTMTARALGAVPMTASSVAAAHDVGRTGDLLTRLHERVAAAKGEIDLPVGHRFDEGRALAALLALAPAVERPSMPTRLDLDARKVLPPERGSALLAYDSISQVAIGLASGAEAIDLVVQRKPAIDDPLASTAAGLEIGTVLGSFDTPYSTDPTEADRNHNLDVGAAAVSRTVLMPGEVFSFNAVVGPRTAEAGYRYATGISAGQLIDVLGGGICQVSSTLFGAAFFSGLELVEARPHSRPSAYVDMGLDSTVVDGAQDLKLRNPFDFPVVFHMTVSQGKVRAEVLGSRRPYQVAFERELEEVLPYETLWRDDPRLRSGAEQVAQHGKRGFRISRKRKLYQGGSLLETETWSLYYPPTSEIVRRGSNPAGAPAELKPAPNLRDPAPSLRIMQ
jgi:vancomycin resistance protein YoaR